MSKRYEFNVRVPGQIMINDFVQIPFKVLVSSNQFDGDLCQIEVG